MVLIASIKITKQYPNIYAIIILTIIIIIDICLVFQPDKLYMVFTGLSLPVVIVISYYNLYPDHIKKAVPYLVLLLIVVGIFLHLWTFKMPI